MKTAYLDPIGGIAGDMFLAALLDCGVEEDYLLQQLKKLPLSPWQWKMEKVQRGAFGGTKINFIIEKEHTCRHLNDIRAIVKTAAFSETAETKILETFDLLAEAEAKAHRIDKNEVHFHEVGAVDTILDICGTVLMLHRLGIEKLIAAPLPMGNGTVTCAHGEIPLPAPAVAELLKGAQVRKSDIQGETVTPTGIALLKAYHCTYGDFPGLTIEQTGCGCGTRNGSIPNILRIFIGDDNNNIPSLYRLECTIDDMTGEDMGFLWEHIAAAGANDMYYTPIYMKKGRPAVKLTVLAEEPILETVEHIIFTDTTTLGMIRIPVERSVLSRRLETLDTPLGKVTYKIATGKNIEKAKAEYEDLKNVAENNGISLREARQICDIIYKKQKDRIK